MFNECPFKAECVTNGFNNDCLEPFGKAIMNPCPHYDEIMDSLIEQGNCIDDCGSCINYYECHDLI